MSNIPLFVIPLVIYNLVMLFGNGEAAMGITIFQTHLISGADWAFRVHDLFILLGVIFLFFEIFKATRIGMASVLDHALSMLVFVIFLVEFLVVAGCGTSTFFLLGVMSLVDVVAGFTVTIAATRRDVALSPDGL